ncbi:putative ATP-dependent RNA helicase KNAG_0C01480 [Huiozyma naganishii CBS 8797]|uniref:ATP-dependent RNA helicase n=1 Tax=Huiozyma naganishii (strain ATCC MYA-139 / BCRC 22969 / CBS 8797 / KCTC 17520 / NBRC 10181 / NCYC 3082 / Yp74L-3) TaxID=1071383 RepID=J7S5N4_HUIN7|nr:hypothetical protein KNAG_0C01480 [Kazachstania naganishii CBS 8797]CCK69261.1 hypothetical protein KNAG_0C01480 [Kazachstania naganishii CBS 8797]
MSANDDGMILNFVTSSGSAADEATGTKKITGGRWKDRRKLRMQLQPKPNKREQEEEGLADDLEPKKKKHESDRKNAEQRSGKIGNRQTKSLDDKLTNENHNTGGRSNKGQLPPNTPGAQIVSSLFTSNRDIATSKNTNAKDESALVNPSNAPLTGDDFESLHTNETLVQHLKGKMEITKPTSIQKKVIPHLISPKNDNDLFINAQTGSGKTLAFLLPIVSQILDMKSHVHRKSGCFALVIAPTRELASQIYQVALQLTQCCHFLVPCLLIGGERKKSEKARLRKGCNFIVGTPGRVLDHLQNTKVAREQLSSSLRYIILDEGDKLMELGFEETLTDILKIVHGIPLNSSKFPSLPNRIIHILCSATTKGHVKKLGDVVLQNYKLISGKEKGKYSKSELAAVPDQLKQTITIVPPKLRLVTLGGELNNITKRHYHSNEDAEPGVTTRTMVFLSCSDSVEFHYEAFSSADSAYKNCVSDSVRELTRGSTVLPCFDLSKQPQVVLYKLHGSLSQPIRSSTLKHFSTDNDATKGKHLIMFCTDVASRGLDLPDVGAVIELDPPFSVEDHLHRIGRTARAGRSGESLLFLLPGEEEGYMDHIRKYHPLGWSLVKYDEDILEPAFKALHVERSDKQQYRDENKKEVLNWDTNATTWHLNVERRILEDSTFKSVALKAYMSHVRAYTTHISSEKQFFNVKCLHLGHLAKSFGLRERPKSMGMQNNKNGKDSSENKKPSKEGAKNKMWRMARNAVKESVSEFNY